MRKLTLPAGKSDHIQWDPDLPGFGVRLRPGKASYVVQYRVGVEQRRKSLGDVRKVTVEDARGIARKRFAQVELGIDPDAEEEKRRTEQTADARTFEKVVEMYLEAQKPRVRPNTYIAEERYLQRHCQPLQRKPVSKVSFEDLASLLRDLVRDHGPTSAARARGALLAFFSWCMRQGLAKANPVIGTENPIRGKEPRDRVLDDNELRLIWRNCLEDDFGKIVRLLLLTACRRDEIGGLRWPEIAESKLLLPKERTKSKRALELTLPATAVAIIGSVPRRNSRETLFGGGTNGFNAWSYNSLALNARITAAEGKALAPWRLHDLRRTVRTRLGKLGVLPHIAELVLNHAGHKSGIGGVYDHHDYGPDIADALRKWEAHLLAIVGPATT
ncbi:integrase arm-type DNA-binding domain-containing protein [Bradyrhizobium sp. CB82]|uniref:tyrosine-type recombinase/integrase n=1 Tax=Bradyrhizobium sp. CB82 TaxID=3039159 RepID=UPI0024B0A301|nr:integrase arm-type DNA-binding domain-containing protein [Bradyrhizobium sp. CB82]WFU37760.1 integrase arm-type DNA-binding domain-containing protein [Bradyrhizobium sp. CB82]